MSNTSTNWEDVYRVQRDRIDELLQKTQGLERENAALRERLDSVQKSHFTLSKDNAALRELTSTLGAPNHVGVSVEKWRELREDKERLDWMEKARPIAWALGSVNCGEYWLLTDIGEKHPEEAEEFATLRAAIDAARKEAQP